MDRTQLARLLAGYTEEILKDNDLFAFMIVPDEVNADNLTITGDGNVYDGTSSIPSIKAEESKLWGGLADRLMSKFGALS